MQSKILTFFRMSFITTENEISFSLQHNQYAPYICDCKPYSRVKIGLCNILLQVSHILSLTNLHQALFPDLSNTLTGQA